MEEAEDAIAVVGIGCNFPGGEGLDNFWKVVVDGSNCSLPIPKKRFDFSDWYDPDDNKAGKSCTAKAALIDGVIYAVLSEGAEGENVSDATVTSNSTKEIEDLSTRL